MSKFDPTPSQKAAIDARGSSVLVSAGAGSGKTRVLTERLMSYICDDASPAELDSFLIISFTRASAAELRGRITEELAERLAADPGNKRLRRQSALVQRARISTIHGFCTSVLRENCHLLGLSPDFKVVDDERAELMKAAALERVMETRYQQPDEYPGFRELADTVGSGRDDRRLTNLVLTLYDKMQCHARPEQWARQQVALLRAPVSDVGQTVWGRELLDSAADAARYWSESFDDMLTQIATDEKLVKSYEPSFSVTADLLRELCRRLDIGWDAARELMPIDFPRIGSPRIVSDPQLMARLKARRTACMTDMKALENVLSESSSELLDEMAKSAPLMEALLSLTLDFDRSFSTDKRRRALLDYSDLEHLTAQLLTNEDDSPTELALRLSRRYTEIMVDEYQDVSRVQDAIFRAVSRGGRNLFMVGDVKQSIYRFRLADPSIFTEKYERYPDYTHAAAGKPRRVLLRENFRSRREILDCANAVFSTCMSRGLGDIDYDENAALIFGAGMTDAVPKPELLILDPLGTDDDEEETADKTELEARLAAQRILGLFAADTQISVRGASRPIEYGDIAILLRSANTVGGVYRRVLAEYGIPVSSEQGSGYFTSVEISTMLSMLAVIDDPHQDIPLIAVLRSPCFGFTADELSDIRAADSDGDFYSALCAAAETQEKCRAFISRLMPLRAIAPDLSAAELTWQLINELDMLSVCSAMADGEQRRANLLEFIELSERFEATGFRGLHRFVLWLRRLSEKGKEISAGAANSSAVQIMSIHRSKGLEFPVVLLCDTSRRFNLQDSRDTVLVHPELGLGPKYTDLDLHLEYPTLARNAIKQRLERETLSEEMRLMYVALTRAKERLIICGTKKDPEKHMEKLRCTLSAPVTAQALRGCSCMLDWLICAALADEGKSFTMRVCSAPREAAAPEDRAPQDGIDETAARELERRLGFSYAYNKAISLPSKVTATELKGHSACDEDACDLAPRTARSFRMPDLTRKDRPATGAEKGVATHLVLQYMDFAKAATAKGIAEEIERLRQRRFITDREAEAVELNAIRRLFGSELGRRIMNADELKREFKFSVMCPAEKLFPGAQGEQLLLQGVIDCCLREGEELMIIDYKTDRVRTDGEIRERAELYRGQLEAYAEAMERITGLRVRERVLYFLAPGRAVSL